MNVEKKSSGRRWTSKEDEFLKLHFDEYGSKYCAVKLNRSRFAVKNRAIIKKIKRKIRSSTTKICTKCWKRKSLSEFSPNKSARFGVQNRCKRCRADWERDRKQTDKAYRLEHTIRNRIRMAIKKNVKSGGSLELLGCDIGFLKNYISELFQQGMSWENHGEWHLDHIRPCCTFDLSNKEEQKQCFNYTNLQPLWAKDNLSKSKRIV